MKLIISALLVHFVSFSSQCMGGTTCPRPPVTPVAPVITTTAAPAGCSPDDVLLGEASTSAVKPTTQLVDANQMTVSCTFEAGSVGVMIFSNRVLTEEFLASNEAMLQCQQDGWHVEQDGTSYLVTSVACVFWAL